MLINGNSEEMSQEMTINLTSYYEHFVKTSILVTFYDMITFLNKKANLFYSMVVIHIYDLLSTNVT